MNRVIFPIVLRVEHDNKMNCSKKKDHTSSRWNVKYIHYPDHLKQSSQDIFIVWINNERNEMGWCKQTDIRHESLQPGCGMCWCWWNVWNRGSMFVLNHAMSDPHPHPQYWCSLYSYSQSLLHGLSYIHEYNLIRIFSD